MIIVIKCTVYYMLQIVTVYICLIKGIMYEIRLTYVVRLIVIMFDVLFQKFHGLMLFLLQFYE